MAKSTAAAPDPDDEDEFLAKLRLTVPGYKLLRTLSHGGQGIVYKAIQEKTGKTVAVKVLRKGPWADETARQRLEREAKVLAALNHPNIVTMVDSGQTPEGHDFLVMNFIPGLSLDEFFKQNKTPDDPGRMLKIFLKICQATNAAHLAGITHRDLSPSNILIDEHDEPHVLDFGLARTAFDRFINVGPRQISVTGQFLGKVAYASPEQARGEAVDIRTDVYALGVILYQILTGGAYPYQVVGSIAEVLNNIIYTKPTPPSKLLEGAQAEAMHNRRRLRKRHPPAVNVVIEAIVLKALEKDANQRYQSAGELGRDVQNYLEGLPTLARPAETGLVEGFRKYSKYIAAAVLLCAIGGAIVLGVRWWHGPQPPVAIAQTGNPMPAPTTEPISVVTPPAQNNSSKEIASNGTLANLTIPTAARPVPTENLKPGQIWTNSISMRLAYIPSGTFIMGSPANEQGRRDDEIQHKVTLTRGFFMAIMPLTQAQWTAVMGNNPSFFGGDDLPVEQVSYNDAVKFCNALSQRDGKVYRLPTEAEWEYACRAGTTTAHYLGDDWDSLHQEDWYYNNSHQQTHPVGQKKPNAWGLFDMIGNVYEWCNDWYGPYTAGDVTDPRGPDEGISRVFRGACWNTNSGWCRSAHRSEGGPDIHIHKIGFRVVMNVPVQVTNANSFERHQKIAALPLYPVDAAFFRERHYKLFRQGIDWSSAEKQCEQMGGRLACATDPKLQVFLQDLKGPAMTAWVGGHLTSSGEWIWLGGWKVDANRISESPYPPGSNRLFLSRSGNLAPRAENGQAPGTEVPMVQGFICEWDPQ